MSFHSALAEFVFTGCLWLVSPAGELLRLSRDQYQALALDDPRIDWTARFSEDDARNLSARRLQNANKN